MLPNFLLLSMSMLYLSLGASVCAAAEPQIKIGLIGDSTVAEQSGWGPAFGDRFNEHVEIINYAKNGATLEALSGKLDGLVELEPDYVLIQFGHNDQKRYDTTVYRDHLRSYVDRIRKSGGKAVIVSSVTRRSFDPHGKIVSNLVKNEKYSYKGTLTDYANAAGAVAGELKLPFINLHRASIAHHNKIGREESMSYNFKEGDKTHFNRKGAEAITNLILKEIEGAVPEISTWLKSDWQTDDRYAGHEALVAETHRASLVARERALRKTIARNTSWPAGAWGETLWSLAALYLNEKGELANARLLKRANDFVALKRAEVETSAFEPEGATETPWAYFALSDYVRILWLFHAGSPHYPGRLDPETEATMKEALWWWVKADSKVAAASLDNLLVLLGTENHDLTRRPNHYLVASLLKDDPVYRDRRFDDGYTAAEHAAAYTTFFREWPRKRATTGLWIEIGSNTYQKYSWPALFNLHELAPDPVLRKRFRLLLDLAFIEEAQISVRGRRGGGRSRAEYGRNGFESYKNLLYAPDGQPAGSSHSKVMETCRYQLPAAAILLRKREFPTCEPFVICNRVLGEVESGRPGDGESRRFAPDSALVNYAWRAPHYLLGSTLQNPALSMADPEIGKQVLKYGGISKQNRWCGMLFDDPGNDDVCAVYPVIEKTRGGRPQHPHWSVQHENVLLLQRIAPQTRKQFMGSYSTGAVGIRFHGETLQRVEEGGWIFAGNGKAFVGVKFLDGGYEWDDDHESASPAGFDQASDKSRILLHAGDVTTHASFTQFRTEVLRARLRVNPEKVEYEFGPSDDRLEVSLYDAAAPGRFSLPRINGKPVDLRPPATWQSPYLNGKFGSDRIAVTVGPERRLLDFSTE